MMSIRRYALLATSGLVLLGGCGSPPVSDRLQGAVNAPPAAESAPAPESRATVIDAIVEYAHGYVGTTQELVDASDVAVKVVATSSTYIRPRNGVVWTQQDFITEEAYWGEAPQEFSILFNGGLTESLDEPVTIDTDHSGPYLIVDSTFLPFTAGGEYLLFLEKAEQGELPLQIAGLGDGYYEVTSDNRILSPLQAREARTPVDGVDALVRAQLNGADLASTMVQLAALKALSK